MKRFWVLCTTTALALICSASAMADRARIDLVMQDYHLSRADAAAAVVLSASLHLGIGDIVVDARDCGCSICDAGPGFVIAYYAHEPFAYVWRHRHGRIWRDYGLTLGVDWDAFNTCYAPYDNFDGLVWVNLCDRAFGCNLVLWNDICGQGLNCWDAVVTVVLGDGHYDRCDRFAFEYRHFDRDWGRVWPAIGRNWGEFERHGNASWQVDNRQASSWSGERGRASDSWNRDRTRDNTFAGLRDRRNNDEQIQSGERNRRTNEDWSADDRKRHSDQDRRSQLSQDRRDRQNRDWNSGNAGERGNRDGGFANQGNRGRRSYDSNQGGGRQGDQDHGVRSQGERDNRGARGDSGRSRDGGRQDRGQRDSGGRDRGGDHSDRGGRSDRGRGDR